MNITVGFTLEGECLVGKTSILGGLKSSIASNNKTLTVVPEYLDIGNLATNMRNRPSEVKKIQKEIIEIEKKRSSLVFNIVARDPAAIVGFDRSLLSCLAYEVSRRESGLRDGYQYLLELYIREYDKGSIILPAQVIHLIAQPETIERNRAIHLAKGHNEVPVFLKNLKVREDQSMFIRESSKLLYGNSYYPISVDNLALDEIVRRCYSYIESGMKTDKILLTKL